MLDLKAEKKKNKTERKQRKHRHKNEKRLEMGSTKYETKFAMPQSCRVDCSS